MKTINLGKKVTSIEVQDDKIIINLEQKYIPKDGEYFYVATKSNNKFIGIKDEGKDITSRYCSYDIKYSSIYIGEGQISNDNQIKEIRPATKEEKDLLNKALEERDKKWNPETKKLESLPKVGDFCIFWSRYKRYAVCAVLKDMLEYSVHPYVTSIGQYSKCAMFQSADHFKEFIKE